MFLRILWSISLSYHLVEHVTGIVIVNKQVFFMFYLHFNELHVITKEHVVVAGFALWVSSLIYGEVE